MKNVIITALILCVNANTSHVYRLANYVREAIESHEQSISANRGAEFGQKKSDQLVQESFPEEEPYPDEEGQAPPEEPYVPEEEPYLPEEDPNLPEQPYTPEEEPLLPDQQPSLPEQPFEGEPESW